MFRVTPLLYAASYGSVACTEVLCSSGASVDKANVWGSTALINAAHNAHAHVVQQLILNDAQVSIRDKDGTALDSALRRLCRMVRGVNSATDDKHPDKPGLVKALGEFNELAGQSNRGTVWHGALERAFAGFRPLLSQAPSAEANLAIGKTDVPAAGAAAPDVPGGRSVSNGKNDAKKKKADAPEPPDEGRCALYAGCAAYVRCIELLRDPAAVKRDEVLRTGRTGGGGGGGATPDGLTQRFGRIRTALALDVSLPMPDALAEANSAMGIASGGSLPDQVEKLLKLLGLE